MRRRHDRSDRGEAPATSRASAAALSADEIAYWIEEFADAPSDLATHNAPSERRRLTRNQQTVDNPFPPGYGEDLLPE